MIVRESDFTNSYSFKIMRTLVAETSQQFEWLVTEFRRVCDVNKLRLHVGKK